MPFLSRIPILKPRVPIKTHLLSIKIHSGFSHDCIHVKLIRSIQTTTVSLVPFSSPSTTCHLIGTDLTDLCFTACLSSLQQSWSLYQIEVNYWLIIGHKQLVSERWICNNFPTLVIGFWHFLALLVDEVSFNHSESGRSRGSTQIICTSCFVFHITSCTWIHHWCHSCIMNACFDFYFLSPGIHKTEYVVCWTSPPDADWDKIPV